MGKQQGINSFFGGPAGKPSPASAVQPGKGVTATAKRGRGSVDAATPAIQVRLHTERHVCVVTVYTLATSHMAVDLQEQVKADDSPLRRIKRKKAVRCCHI